MLLKREKADLDKIIIKINLINKYFLVFKVITFSFINQFKLI